MNDNRKQTETPEVELEVEWLAESSKAVLVEADFGQVWVPKSLIIHSTSKKKGPCTLTIPEWFANKSGML